LIITIISTLRCDHRLPVAAQNLLADNAALSSATVVSDDTLQAAAQALLDDIQPGFDFEEGEVSMFVMDMPDLPPQYEQVMLVQASQSQQTKAQYERTIGLCALINNPPNAPKEPWAGSDGLSPVVAVSNYFRAVENNLDFKYEGGRASVLEKPKHGVLQATDGEGYYYFPEAGYLGTDRATFLVEIAGRKYKAVHYLRVMEIVPEDGRLDKRYCPNGRWWKISLNPDDPNAAQYTFEYPSQWVSAPWTGTLSGVEKANLSFADLAGGAVGQTTANTNDRKVNSSLKPKRLAGAL